MKSLKKYSGLSVFALALVFGASAAKADLDFVSNYGLEGSLGNPDSELAWLEGIVGADDLVYLGKDDGGSFEWGAIGSGLSSNVTGNTGEVSWDLTDSGYELRYVLLKDGNIQGFGHLYAIFAVTPAQYLASDWESIFFGAPHEGREISHVTFFGVQGTTTVPEPAMLLLLGAGLIGVALLRRRRTDIVARAA